MVLLLIWWAKSLVLKMPYKSERLGVAGTKYDRRRKLSPDQAKAIKFLKNEGYSYRQLAAMFNCSKWTVQNLVNPQIRKKQPARTTEYWTEKKREYRRRKHQLYISGQLKSRTRNLRTITPKQKYEESKTNRRTIASGV